MALGDDLSDPPVRKHGHDEPVLEKYHDFKEYFVIMLVDGA